MKKKDPAAVNMGRRRWASIPKKARSEHMRKLALLRWAKRKMRALEEKP